MPSIWEDTARLPRFAPLQRDIATDVLVIGGGLCGIVCTYLLRQAGIDCVLTEATTLCGGVTASTTAKITSQHGLIYHKLLARFGAQTARQYYDANEAALRRYARLCQTIDCDFTEQPSFVFAHDSRPLAQEAAALRQLGIPASCVKSIPLPLSVAGAIRFPKQAQFHPLKFAAALVQGLPIYEHTRVQELVGTTAVTSGGKVRANKVIVATHFPFINKHGWYFLKLYQHRSYVLALKNAPLPDGMYVDEAPKGLSFRTYGDYLLLGGGGHRTGKQGGGWQELRDWAARHYPQATECAHWATQDCMSLDDMPYIGAYAGGTEGLYVATGFHKWGMSSSMVAANLLTDLVQGKESPYRALFSPSRRILHPQLFYNIGETVADYVIPTTRRCPHLGCALRWNPCEHTWDCPCHGSRFTEDGKLLDGPATGDWK